MNTLFFYNVGQSPYEAHFVNVPAILLNELTSLITQSCEDDGYGNSVAFVVDLGNELEEALTSVKASVGRIAELLNCEFVTTSTLCN